MSERLISWTKHFLQHRDIFQRKIVDIEDTDTGILVRKTDFDEEYFIDDNLEFSNANKETKSVIVCMNSNKNFQKLVSEWKVLIGYPNLKIIFVEKINSNKYWQIQPFHHDKITEAKSLKTGLKALADGCK